MKLKKLIEDYLEYLKFEKGMSESTLSNYKNYLNKFYKFTGNIKAGKINYRLARRFIIKQYYTKYSQNYQNYVLIGLRGMFRYANTHDIPTMNFKTIELRRRICPEVAFLEKEELLRLLNAPDTQDPRGLRDKAIMELLLSTGMRCGEIINLQRDQLRKNNCLTISGKYSKMRLVFISKRARRWLDKYLAIRKDNCPYLFFKYRKNEDSYYQSNSNKNANESKGFSERSVERIIKKYAKIAEITKNINPHTLRHFFAVNLLENGVDIFYIKELLGHRHIYTTQTYLHTTNKRLEMIHSKYHIL